MPELGIGWAAKQSPTANSTRAEPTDRIEIPLFGLLTSGTIWPWHRLAWGRVLPGPKRRLSSGARLHPCHVYLVKKWDFLYLLMNGQPIGAGFVQCPGVPARATCATTP